MCPGPYICPLFYIISNSSPVAVSTSERFTSILTDNIVMDSYRQVILKNQYKTVIVIVQDTAYGPGHCLGITTHCGHHDVACSNQAEDQPMTQVT